MGGRTRGALGILGMTALAPVWLACAAHAPSATAAPVGEATAASVEPEPFALAAPVCADDDACEAACRKEHIPQACVLRGRVAERAGAAEAFRWYERACQVWWNEGCVRLAALAPSADQEQACRRGIAEACEQLGWKLQRGGGSAAEVAQGDAFYARAVARYLAACELGSGLDCAAAGTPYDDGAGVARNAARAAQLYARACALHDPFGCEKSGTTTASRAVADAACESAGASACNSVGLRLELGRAIDADPAHAVELYLEACARNDGLGCALAAYAYEVGIGTPRDRGHALDFYQKGCALDDMQGCYGEARLHRVGGASDGIVQDAALAAELFDRTCERSSDGLGCRELTEMYQSGEVPRRSTSEIVQRYDITCQKNDTLSCTRAAVLLLEGKLIARDIPRALGLYARGCELGDGTACFAAAQLYVAGDLIAEDQAVALTWFRRGCDQGDSESCLEVGRRLAPPTAARPR